MNNIGPLTWRVRVAPDGPWSPDVTVTVDDVVAEGVQGTPGHYVPVDATSIPPAADVVPTLVPYPETAWKEGTHVLDAEETEWHWTGSEWATGTAPAPPAARTTRTTRKRRSASTTTVDSE